MKPKRTKVATLAATLITFGSLAAVANGALTITIQESGPDIVATYLGSMDLTGLTLAGSGNGSGILGDNGAVVVAVSGTSTFVPVDFYTGVTTSPTVSFATSFSFGSSNVGDTGFGVQILNSGPTPRIFTSSGYTSGDPINAIQTFSGLSFEDLGLNPESYVWEWSSDTATVVIVPEPSSIFLLGFASLGILARRKRTA